MGCGSAREDFVRGRVLSACAESWPVCDAQVGCLLGNTSFTEGRFPGSARFGVVLREPSTVRLTVLLEDVRSEGTAAVLTFHEDGCRDRQRLEFDGRLFVGEAERLGTFSREVDLFGEGEHLIELSSDAQASYVLKVEVLPKRGE